MDRLRRILASFGKAEFLFVWYGLTMALLLALHGGEVPGRTWWILFHLAFVPIARFLSRFPITWWHILILLAWVVTCFSTLGIFLKDLVPEPMQFEVLALNEALGGMQVQAGLSHPPAWLAEVCVLCYSSFYFLPLILMLALARERKSAAIHHLLILVGGGFLLSYIGYACWPTLPPYRFLVFDEALHGGPLFPFFHRWLYEGEPLRQDCMPSGHTMMTLLTMYAAWIYSRRQLLWLLPVGSFLILGTIVLRYHWFADLLAAIPFFLLAIYLFRDEDPQPVEEPALNPGGSGSGS